MRSNFSTIMPYIFQEEGGYVDNPADPGGATNMGITIGTLSKWTGHSESAQDVKNLTKDAATEIYKKQYWDKIDGDSLPSGVDYAMLDFAVNSGPGHAIKMLQQILGVLQDGFLGPATFAALSARSPQDLIDRLSDERAAWLRGLAAAATFGKGWQARVERVRTRALALAEKPINDIDAAHSAGISFPHSYEPAYKGAPEAEQQSASITTTLQQPGLLGTLASIISGLVAIIIQDGPLETALACAMIALSLIGVIYFVKR
ncbi:acetylmuramidase [Ochrobactrum soli]|uniref:Glycoside hydrolase family 108 protein n=1 Tax=Ochrobactrum teleogrylli TaxID=2479765 RepID=A0ABD5JWT4_9HYPH|nr:MULTISPECIES: glycoside hydrolase family 108 protein [Brucella]RRD25941.1 acetylmuramidase [Brucellaceae bacterium VT-16-1752]WHT42662.1 glycoside hydrolase family 108 protein [Ochrobactrum sp. SSR]MDX4072351.1 glycoside hydrolase family 108 protein [Brucella sp. NBRC 113783]RLL76513.1 acetylmuramidase [[Ochrobactrum] soli]WHS30873.1 glycoside hydrolase family 108 protein [Brucella sp. NM4]